VGTSARSIQRIHAQVVVIGDGASDGTKRTEKKKKKRNRGCIRPEALASLLARVIAEDRGDGIKKQGEEGPRLPVGKQSVVDKLTEAEGERRKKKKKTTKKRERGPSVFLARHPASRARDLDLALTAKSPSKKGREKKKKKKGPPERHSMCSHLSASRHNTAKRREKNRACRTLAQDGVAQVGLSRSDKRRKGQRRIGVAHLSPTDATRQ